jgi:branched-chain amino acid transport system permease protein
VSAAIKTDNRQLVIVGGLVLVILALLPFALRPYGIFVLSLWLVNSLAAMGLNLTLGYAGQVSMAQAAFVGIGAYVTALLMPLGVPFPVTFLLAGLLCFIVGWLLGYPALRVQGHYLAFVTLAFGTLAYLVARNEDWLTNGIAGIVNIKRPAALGVSFQSAIGYWWLLLAVGTAITWAIWRLVCSPWGRAFVALRENPLRAASLGVDTSRYTLMAFAIGSAVAGLAGALYAPLVQYIDPTSLALTRSLNLLLMVVVGGSGYFLGPFLGAFVAVIVPESVRFAQDYYLIVYSALVIVVLMFYPKGLAGLLERLFVSRWFGAR